MIEQTERDQVYYNKRLDHLKALRKRIQKDGAGAIPKFDPHPGRDRPLQQIGYVSDQGEEDSGTEEDDGHVYDVMNALESCSDSDSMWLSGGNVTDDIHKKYGDNCDNINNLCDNFENNESSGKNSKNKNQQK